MNLIDEIKSDSNGAAILAEWLGSTLRPVTQSQADHRSISCVRGNDGEKCPFNKEPLWWERNLKLPVARFIKRQVETKRRLKMETPLDDSLFMCSCCGCEITTKIWVNIQHIAAHTPKENIDKMPDFCWQKREILGL